jgi:hypothetical protein
LPRRVFDSLSRVVGVLRLPLAFAAVAFLFSFIGLLNPQHIHLHEYSLPDLLKEVFGHVAFGLVAALPLWITELSLFLLAGGVAVLIDVDHLLGALNAPVSSRPDHSIPFFILSTLLVYLLAKRGGMLEPRALKAAGAVAAGLLSHISYDIFAAVTVFHGTGYAFPFFAPLNFALIQMPSYSWVLFELLGFGISIVVLLSNVRRGGEK